MLVNIDTLNNISDWAILKVFNDPLYPLYAIKRYDEDAFYVFNMNGSVDDTFSTSGRMVRFNHCMLVSNANEKSSVIQSFEDISDNHIYFDNDTVYFNFDDEEREEYDEE